MERIHEEFLIHISAVEDELMDRDGKERARHFSDTRLVEILKVLTGEEECRLLLSHALEAVADVGDHGGIGEPQVQLVDRGDGIARSQKLVRHIREQREQNGVAQIFRYIVQSLDTEDEEFGVCDVCMPVKKARVRSPAHGVEPKKEVAQHFARIKTGGIIVVIGFLDRIVQIGKDGVIGRLHSGKVRVVGNAPLFI